jgi:hypothetical protein
MHIKVTGLGVPYKDGKFEKVELFYDRDGKPTKRVLVNVGSSKDVYAKLVKAKPGDQYEIELTKDGDFYNWTGIKSVLQDYAEAASGSAAKVSSSTKSTYETHEERAFRQRCIVAQSSVSSAILTVSNGMVKNEAGFQGILNLATEIYEYVMNKADNIQSEEELKNDIPY